MNFTGYAMRRFIKNFKGYNIYIEDNEEATASSPYYIGVPELPFFYSTRSSNQSSGVTVWLQ